MKKETLQNNYETLQFKSKDGLLITADFYSLEQSKNLILLCHRSHCNRGEYRETAPKLNKLGFSCLAIDQRSGLFRNRQSKKQAFFAVRLHGLAFVCR